MTTKSKMAKCKDCGHMKKEHKKYLVNREAYWQCQHNNQKCDCCGEGEPPF